MQHLYDSATPSARKSMEKLYLYRSFKTANTYEYYLTHVHSWYHRTTLTNFRCGCFHLQINKGRTLNIPRHLRLCSFCNLRRVEDEFHFLLECPFYSELRISFLPRYFFSPTTSRKFITLLNTENKNLLYRMSKFLIYARRYRGEFIDLDE